MRISLLVNCCARNGFKICTNVFVIRMTALHPLSTCFAKGHSKMLTRMLGFRSVFLPNTGLIKRQKWYVFIEMWIFSRNGVASKSVFVTPKTASGSVLYSLKTLKGWHVNPRIAAKSIFSMCNNHK